MRAAPQRTQILGASAGPCRLLKWKALRGSLRVKTVQGSGGTWLTPPTTATAPTSNLLAFKPLSTRTHSGPSQPGAAHSWAQRPWSRAVASTCPARLHTCSPPSPTCLAEWSTAPGEPSQAARLAGGSGRCHFLLCHYVSPARLPALRPCLDLIPQHGPLSPSFPSHRGEKGPRRWTGCIIKEVQGRGTGVGT